MPAVAIADDHPAVGMGLRLFFDQRHSARVIWEAASVPEALEAVAQRPPDVLIADLRFGTQSGFELIASRGVRTVVYSSYDSELYVMEAFARGVYAFVRKNEQLEVLEEAVLLAVANKRLIRPKDESILAKRNDLMLSDRENEVIRAIYNGLSNGEISTKLKISETTVKTHIKRIFAKLGARSRSEAVRLAIERGVIFGPK